MTAEEYFKQKEIIINNTTLSQHQKNILIINFKEYLKYIISDEKICIKVNTREEQDILMTLLDKYERYSPSGTPWLSLNKNNNPSFPLYLIYDSYFKHEASKKNSYEFYPKDWLNVGNSIVDMKDIKFIMKKIYGM